MTGTASYGLPARVWRRLAGHGHLAIIAGLVAVASLATATVVVHGVRQLDTDARRKTTPYLAEPPSGPVRPPAPTPTPRPEAGTDGVRSAPEESATRGSDPAEPGLRPLDPGRTRTPEVTSPLLPPRSGESAGPRLPAPDEPCRAGDGHLGQCLMESPWPPGAVEPPPVLTPGSR